MGRKIDCIQRLIEKNLAYDEIAEWLILNKFTTDIVAKEYTRPKEQAEFIFYTLKQGVVDEKVILLYFEWTILPTETIKITCTITTEEKQFTYGL